MSRQLRATIVMDYQNVHLTGHDLFPSTRPLARHETLVDPYLFAALDPGEKRRTAATPAIKAVRGALLATLAP